MCLKDRVHRFDDGNRGNGGNGGKKHQRKACKRFNKGLCKNGLSCHYEHRCTVPECGKFGHGAHICRMKNGASTNTANPNPGSQPTGSAAK